MGVNTPQVVQIKTGQAQVMSFFLNPRRLRNVVKSGSKDRASSGWKSGMASGHLL
jgi:tRNA A-37 threonylcarbamoyl transferase component Bud32